MQGDIQTQSGPGAERRAQSKRRLSLALLCALIFSGAALACASPSLGARPHEFSKTIGEACTVEPCTGAHLKEPNGVAVDEASGDIYVVDREGEAEGPHGRVVQFNAEGTFQSELSGPNATGSGTLTEGSKTITAVLTTTGAFNIEEEISAPGLEAGTKIEAIKTNEGVLELELTKAATASELATLTAKQLFEGPETIAVDNSCVQRKVSLTQNQCEEEDPSNGDVYVVDQGVKEHRFEHRMVDKFSPAGEYLGSISTGPISDSEEGRLFRVLTGVAVDQGGSVWVYQEDKTASRHTNGTPNKLVLPPVHIALAGSGSSGFAIDSKGSFYASSENPGKRVGKASPTGAVLIKELDNEDSTAVAVDQSTDDPVICNTTTLAVLDPEATLLERLGEEKEEKHLTQCAGVGVNTSQSTLYASDAAKGQLVVFGPAHPSPPKVESEAFSEVTSQSAILRAGINPRSEPNEGATEYHFQYGRCTTLDPASCKESGYEAVAPIPDGQISPDFEVHSVSIEIEGLQPNSTYHFRAIAHNSHGAGQPGEEVTFTSEGEGGQLTLPDNRGWELASPPDKLGALIEPISEAGVVQAAVDGSAITYVTNSPTEAQLQGAAASVQVLSRRGEAAWSTRDIAIPHGSAAGSPPSFGPEQKFFTPELTQSAVQPLGEFNPKLSDEASEQTAYLHDLSTSCGSHCFRPLVTGKPGFANVPEGIHFGGDSGPEFFGASEDLTHVVLLGRVALQEDAVPGELYVWDGGLLVQLSILPNEKPPSAGVEIALGLGPGRRAARHAISSNGSLIVWSIKTPSGLYTRDVPREETIQLDAAQAPAGEGEKEKEEREKRSGGGEYQIASADGSRVFFTDEKRLTEDSGAGKGEADLYECRVETSPKLSCSLTDLTPKHGEEAADVQGGVPGASEDGSMIYFVAKGVLDESANSHEEKATSGQQNLYVLHDGVTKFIATLAGEDAHDWSGVLSGQPTRVSNNGQWLEFMSAAQPTGYDNRDVATGKPVAEVYLYDAQSNELHCASCMPSGVRPVGVQAKKLLPGEGGLVGGPREIWPANALVAANVPGWTTIVPNSSRYQPRYLTNQGRLFFDTADPLVAQDSNGTQDVYEYDPLGMKGAEEKTECEASTPTYSPRSGGCVALISSGRSAQESAFMDASESGDDVYFLTSAKLSPLDNDTAFDIYDAHVCTKAEPCITFPTVQSPPCTTEASCKAPPTPQPSIFGAPASATFQGPGNSTYEGSKTKPTSEELRKKHLAQALKACRAKHNKKKRKACEAQARKRYAPPKGKGKAKKQAHHAKKAKAKGSGGK